ncbi:MAG: TatD family hydrolase [Candidatus ainarchaeum sp.]|nr:TatD family hydrolase [Candidatus ainarchaeum sp.]
MHFIDAHCHLDRFPDIPSAARQAREAGAKSVVSSGYDLPSSLASLEAAREFPGFIHACVGLAPTTAMGMPEQELLETLAQLKTLARNAVAIGEIGLDYHWPSKAGEIDAQKKSFSAQLDLAMEAGLPAVIHSRKAEEDAIRMLLEKGVRKAALHFFSGTPAQAERAAAAGHLFTVPPIRSKTRAETVSRIPLDLLLLESDAPYAGKTPADCLKSAEFVAEAKGISIHEALKATTENAKRFFSLGSGKESD